MLRRDVTCSNCDGIGRWYVPVYGDSLRCEECGGKGSLREWRIGGLLVVLFALVSIAMFILGVWWGMDVQAFNRSMVAVGDYEPQLCGDLWVVDRHETAWKIAGYCYGTDRTGEYVHAIGRANPGVDVGRLQIGQPLVLPERGRR